PKVMGKKVSLPSLWVMAAVIIGGRLAGASGMLFGVPITSIAYTLLKEATIKREEKKRLKENAEQVFE
ncbi:MAG: AI-2E family transporter, partial [Clostridia bacterium]|nr:AI-2E family transporter [Clostridia bacterium]